MTWFWLLVIIAAAWFLAYRYASLVVWTISVAVALLLLTEFSSASIFTLTFVWILFAAIFVPLNIYPLRSRLISKPIMTFFQKIMPAISATEKEALEAGTITWEGDLFSGRPDWEKLKNLPTPTLTDEEQAFLAGPVEELCRMIDEWEITHERFDMPPSMWEFIKAQGFFGMIIPKKYGGKGFSAWMHAAVLIKVYARSAAVASTIAVPNSLGPAELIEMYGTEEQKKYYLPRLATGEEIPCFGLTGPTAGSDAASIPDKGVVCRGKFKGKEVIGIKLNWNKRYITLAPVATVIGLAFKLSDPENLLSDVTEPGITCALVPASTKGVTRGRRHAALNVAFQNGPTQGKDVFIPAGYIIGGPAMAGQGWRMLMECLGIGRGITLPSSAVGGAKVAAMATGAYARLRKQFGVSIGRFEGVEEPLARIGGMTYIVDAAIRFVVPLIDQGEKPALASAIVKYHTTEMARKIVNDAMDIHGGKGICAGPNNYLASGYQGIPISITVEGANILSRSLIIFGQGALRCHPYILDELEAVQANDLKAFDKALFGHFGFMTSNKLRAFFLSLTNGRFVAAPTGPTQRYYQLVTRFSTALAFASELAVLALGADLKRREKLSARLGDVLSMLYLTSAVLKRFDTDGSPVEDLPFVDWSCQTLLFNAQQALDAFIKNFPNRLFAFSLRCVAFPLGKRLSEPSDHVGHKVAKLLLEPSGARDRLIAGISTAAIDTNPAGMVEAAFKKMIAVSEIEKTVEQAVRAGEINGVASAERVANALRAEIIDREQSEQLLAAFAARDAVIAVDDFAPGELGRGVN